MTAHVLVHSPLVGASGWAGVAEILPGPVSTPSLVGALTSPGPLHDTLARVVADAVRAAPELPVLTVHSGAGALVPAVLAMVPVRAVVFVDATLPHPGRRWTDTVPADMADELRSAVGPDGLLPPWHEWFPPEVLDDLLPDPTVRAAFRADVPRVPLRYLEEVAPRADGWDATPCSYLRLSDGYLDADAQAQRRGWPIARMDSHHLGIVTDPSPVARAIDELVSRMAPPA